MLVVMVAMVSWPCTQLIHRCTLMLLQGFLRFILRKVESVVSKFTDRALSAASALPCETGTGTGLLICTQNRIQDLCLAHTCTHTHGPHRQGLVPFQPAATGTQTMSLCVSRSSRSPLTRRELGITWLHMQESATPT